MGLDGLSDGAGDEVEAWVGDRGDAARIAIAGEPPADGGPGGLERITSAMLWCEASARARGETTRAWRASSGEGQPERGGGGRWRPRTAARLCSRTGSRLGHTPEGSGKVGLGHAR